MAARPGTRVRITRRAHDRNTDAEMNRVVGERGKLLEYAPIATKTTGGSLDVVDVLLDSGRTVSVVAYQLERE